MPQRGEQKRRPSPGRKRTGEPPRAAREIPRKKSIVAVDAITSPKGRRYTILETDQMDPYDDPKPKAGGPAARSKSGGKQGRQ
jgi:hypothetical protein